MALDVDVTLDGPLHTQKMLSLCCTIHKGLGVELQKVKRKNCVGQPTRLITHVDQVEQMKPEHTSFHLWVMHQYQELQEVC